MSLRVLMSSKIPADRAAALCCIHPREVGSKLPSSSEIPEISSVPDLVLAIPVLLDSAALCKRQLIGGL